MVALVLALLLLAFAGVHFFLRDRAKPEGVIASLRLPDGSEYVVTQYRNNTDDPFSVDYLRFPGPLRKPRWTSHPYCVSFYMRPAGGAWGWCYIDHRTPYWSNAAMTYDPATDVVTITESGQWRAALDRQRNAFAIGLGKPIRWVAAPQQPCGPIFPIPWHTGLRK
jgi:hypothetical protein